MSTDWSDQIIISELADEPALSEELAGIVERAASAEPHRAKHVVLNFGNVNYLSSSHLAQLLRLRKKLLDTGRNLVLCSLNDNVWSIMLLTGLDRVFRFAPEPLTALATLQIEAEPGANA
ncbi:MAG: STAS domain-containing protein [Phycisphaeraceae bacterium]|nr:STAS domain-containing protein [Phycisphaeraceae bacterium]